MTPKESRFYVDDATGGGARYTVCVRDRSAPEWGKFVGEIDAPQLLKLLNELNDRAEQAVVRDSVGTPLQVGDWARRLGTFTATAAQITGFTHYAKFGSGDALAKEIVKTEPPRRFELGEVGAYVCDLCGFNGPGHYWTHPNQRTLFICDECRAGLKEAL